MAESLPDLAPASTAAKAVRARTGATPLMPCLLALVLFALLAPAIASLEPAWRNDPNYSHGYLIPLICLWLGLRGWHRAGIPGAGEWGVALLTLIPGALLLLAATVAPIPMLIYFATSLILRGVAVGYGGKTWASWFTAPILFAFFMFPVPNTWTSYAALWLQEIVSQLSTGALDQFVICRRTGTVISVVGLAQPLHVAAECSGLRQLIGFVAFAVLLGMLLDRPAWIRVLLVLLSIPFTVLANVVRVLLMSFGALNFGTEWMDGWLHHAPAAFTMPVGFALIVGADYLLWRLAGRPQPSFHQTLGAPAPVGRGGHLGAVVVSLIVLLIAQTGLKAHLDAAGDDPFPPLRASLEELPFELNSWQGDDRPERDQLRSTLPYAADDLLLRNYWSAGGNAVQVYAVYSRIGDDRKHHPEICVREVNGAPEDVGARSMISLDATGQRQVQRFVFQTGAIARTTVYYWHYAFYAPTSGNSIAQTLHQRWGRTPPSLTVQVWLNSAEPSEWDLIEKNFLPAMDRALQERWLPATARIDASRLPVALLRE